MTAMGDKSESTGGARAAAKAPRGRRFLIDTAPTLFDEHGYHNTSMEDIARRVGLAKPTLYHYFRSKDKILFEIHNAMIEMILDIHQERLPGTAGRCGELLQGMMGDIIWLMRPIRAICGSSSSSTRAARELQDDGSQQAQPLPRSRS